MYARFVVQQSPFGTDSPFICLDGPNHRRFGPSNVGIARVRVPLLQLKCEDPDCERNRSWELDENGFRLPTRFCGGNSYCRTTTLYGRDSSSRYQSHHARRSQDSDSRRSQDSDSRRSQDSRSGWWSQDSRSGWSQDTHSGRTRDSHSSRDQDTHSGRTRESHSGRTRDSSSRELTCLQPGCCLHRRHGQNFCGGDFCYSRNGPGVLPF